MPNPSSIGVTGPGTVAVGSARLLLVAAALVLGTVSAGQASAFWTAGGTGTAGGTAATLSPPTGVTATASAGTGTVRITWTQSAAPEGAPDDGFYVQRFEGATPSPACSTSPASLTGAAACDDTAVGDGTYTYTVTTVFRSWTAQSVASAPVTVSSLHHLTVSAPGTAGAGEPLNVIVTARTASGTRVAGYVGTVHFTSTDLRVTLPADYTFVPADAGTRTFTDGLTFRTSGSQTVTAADTVQAALTATAGVTVSPAAATRLAFSQQPTSTTAGATMAPAVTVRIEDGFGNLTTSTAGVGLVVTGGTATLNGTTTRAGVAGLASFADLSVTKAGAYTLTATSAGLTAATSASFTISAAAASRLCVVATMPVCSGGTLAVAGGSSTSVRIWIIDQYGNVATATSPLSIGLSVTGDVDVPLPPTNVTIGSGLSTSSSFSVTIRNGGKRSITVTATATGLTFGVLTLST